MHDEREMAALVPSATPETRTLLRAACDDEPVSVDGTAGAAGATPPLPSSIWVVAWASVAGQAVQLVHQGVRHHDEVSLVLSVVLSAVLVGYVSAGVVRARTVRLVVAWVVLVLALITGLVGLFSVDNLGQAPLAAVSFATAVVALAGLARFRRTDWYAWQRTRPPVHHGTPIGQLVTIGVIVGILGALAVPADGGLKVDISVAGR